MAFYGVHGQGRPSWSRAFNPQLVQLVGKFWVFLSHTAPWVSTVFFFFFPHLCLWVIHWGLLLRLPWRTWVAPVRASYGGAAAAWFSGVLAAPGTQGSWWPEQQEIQYSGRVWQPVLARTLQCSCLENPWQTSLAGHSLQGHKELDWTKMTLCVCTLFFWPMAALPQWELSVKAHSCLACRDPGDAKSGGTWTTSTAGVKALSRSFSEALVAGDQQASLVSLSP